jgi:hypothetical protein
MQKQDLTYEQIMRAGPDKLERLADADRLSDATLARCAHLGRFLEAIGNAMPNPDLKVGDVLSEDEVERLWKRTADPELQ